MKTITTTVYKFNELNENSKRLALDSNYDINVDYDWWDNFYENMDQIGVNIKGFDLDRGNSIDIEIQDTETVTADLVIANWGESCESVSICKKFLSDMEVLVSKYSDGKVLDMVTYENESDFDNECDDLELEFKKDISNILLGMLKAEYDYLTSEEAIIDMFDANDYHFTTEGELTI